MIKRTVNIDFSQKNGKLKPINGLNNGPRFGYDLECDLTDNYREMSPPIIRLSNVESPYLSSKYLDVHCIFPDFSLDERFDGSYNFAPTDRLLAAVKDTGAEIFLRLGESPEREGVKKYTRPPLDCDKFARICSKIISHYNKGWARGFKYNIKYVEIMCSVDTRDGFAGDRNEYFKLYSAVADRLKEDHPKLRIGAYSSGGFFSLNHYDATPEEKGYVSYLEDFIDYIKESGSALDFLSWKCCADSPEELNLHSNYARSYLNQAGLKRTQSIVTEFSLRDTCEHFGERDYPARLASSLIVAQKSNIDMMFLAGISPNSAWNPLYSLDDRKNPHLYASYHVMSAFGALSRLGTVVDSTEDYRREMYSLATTDGERGACVLTAAEYSGVIEIRTAGREFSHYSIKGVIGGGERASGYFTEHRDLLVKGGAVSLRVGKNEVYFLTFYNK